MEKTKILVITQEDSFVIPKNIFILKDIKNIDVVAAVKINSIGAVKNKKNLFLKGFGYYQVSKMSLIFFINVAMDFLDKIFLYKIGFLKSIKSAASIITFNGTRPTNSDPVTRIPLSLAFSQASSKAM